MRRRHKQSCPAARGGAARCIGSCSYETQIGPRGARITRTHKTFAAADRWLIDARKSSTRVPARRAPTLRDAKEEWFKGARSGAIRTRRGGRFRDGTLRVYENSYDRFLDDELGSVRIDQISRGDLNKLARRLTARPLAASTVRNAFASLRVILRVAVSDDDLDTNVTRGMELPSGTGRRMRFLTLDEISRFLNALDEKDRALWATAFFAGLRRGELMALRWEHIDLGSGAIHVRKSFDPHAGVENDPKSRAGRRSIGICAELREHLAQHRARAGARPRGYVFCRSAVAGVYRPGTASQPFSADTHGKRTTKAAIAAGLAPFTLHDGRHTFASLMIAAMVKANEWNPKALQAILGHESIQQTYDRYGHLWPGTEQQLSRMLDTLLTPLQAPDESSDDLTAKAHEFWATVDNTSSAIAVPLVTMMIGRAGQWISQQRPDHLLPSVTAR
jgi:integrase